VNVFLFYVFLAEWKTDSEKRNMGHEATSQAKQHITQKMKNEPKEYNGNFSVFPLFLADENRNQQKWRYDTQQCKNEQISEWKELATREKGLFG
jgi:hypothetical protein